MPKFLTKHGKNILTSCQNDGIVVNMKAMPVGEVKTHFSRVLEEVKQGNRIGILYGRAKKPVAMIVPYIEEKANRRKIGILDGKIKIKFRDDFEMTTEELLEM
jgi:antitoxin (DNA-binding transcriptional repressor) of toxin-antitoxin stability system